MAAYEKDLRETYEYFAGLGRKEGMETFKSTDFAKLVKDAGLFVNKGNKFNLKPPNRVDFVFTYACTNGPGGMKKNKTMSLGQLCYAVGGIAKESGIEAAVVVEKLKSAKPKFDATKSEATRFHDDKSNYTGYHKLVHADLDGVTPITDKDAIRANRAMACLSGVDLEEAMRRKAEVEQTFADADNGDGLLDANELMGCLRKLKPRATDSTLKFVQGWLMKAYDENNDGLLSLAEFIQAYNQLVDVLNQMGDSDMCPQIADLLKQKYLRFCDCAPGKDTGREEEMDSARFKKFCNDTFPKVFPKTQDGSTKVDMIWAKMISERREISKKENKITFVEFNAVGLVEILATINERANPQVKMDQIIARVLQSAPKTDATATEAVRFHDDKSSYTGAHTAVHGVAKKKREIVTAGW